MFKIELDNSKKAMVITVGGFFKEDEGMNFLKDYKAKTDSINPSDYSLVIDGATLLVSKPEMIPILENCFNLYKSTGFKKICGVSPTSTISSIQLQKVAKSTNLPIEFSNTLNDVMKKL